MSPCTIRLVSSCCLALVLLHLLCCQWPEISVEQAVQCSDYVYYVVRNGNRNGIQILAHFCSVVVCIYVFFFITWTITPVFREIPHQYLRISGNCQCFRAYQRPTLAQVKFSDIGGVQSKLQYPPVSEIVELSASRVQCIVFLVLSHRSESR